MPNKKFTPLPSFTTQEISAFWKRVGVTGPNNCWVGRRKYYGKFKKDGKTYSMHRIAYFLHYGEDPGPDLVCHNCPGGDNPACGNPGHLYKGDYSDNNRDTYKKGRQIPHGPGFMGSSHPQAQLCEADVINIRASYSGKYGEQTAIARQLGVSQSLIQRIVRHKTWTHV